MKNPASNIVLWTATVACLPASAAMANPIAVQLTPYGLLDMGISNEDMLKLVLLPLGIELAMVLALTRKFNRPLWATALVFVPLHVVTWPITMMLACFIGPLAEVAPLILEALFWKWWFRKGENAPTFSKCLLLSFVVNAASYVAGYLIARPVLH